MLYVLADAHAGTAPEEDRALVELLDRLAPGELLILGDLFRAFVGLPRYWTPTQNDLLAALARFRDRGGRVRFVVGNREYLVRRRPELPFDEIIADRSVIELAGVRTLVSHGDRLDPKDRSYRVWYRVSRSGAASLLLHLLPGALGRRLAERAEAGLAQTNRAYKAGPIPIEALEQLGREAAKLGASRALVGHFHEDRSLEVRDGVPVQLAPPWLEHQRILISEPSGRLRSVSKDDLPTPEGQKLG